MEIASQENINPQTQLLKRMKGKGNIRPPDEQSHAPTEESDATTAHDDSKESAPIDVYLPLVKDFDTLARLLGTSPNLRRGFFGGLIELLFVLIVVNVLGRHIRAAVGNSYFEYLSLSVETVSFFLRSGSRQWSCRRWWIRSLFGKGAMMSRLNWDGGIGVN